jgi:hypothetical protein
MFAKHAIASLLPLLPSRCAALLYDKLLRLLAPAIRKSSNTRAYSQLVAPLPVTTERRLSMRRRTSDGRSFLQHEKP